MELATVLARLRRRWWVVAALAALAVLGASLALGRGAERHERTIHFVLRPDSSLSSRNLPGALEQLKSQGALVQTVLGVLSSNEMLRRAGAAARVTLAPSYTIKSSARPGSALIDSTVGGPDPAVVARLGAGFARVASDYVAASYSAYALDQLGSDPGGGGPRLHPAQVVLLALLLGGALGVGLVLAEPRLESRLRPTATRGGPADTPRSNLEVPPDHAPEPVWVTADARCRATTSKGLPCRNRVVDDRGYCRLHLARIEADGADVSWENGAGALVRIAEPAGRSPESVTRRGGLGRPTVSHEDED
jgi:hypothetical protein